MSKDLPLSTRLRSWIDVKGISLTEGAVKIGISYTYFTQILKGKKNPARFLKERIERILEE